eukprot:scaffold235751_cov24-Tisochrysis_lutea.AAC.2
MRRIAASARMEHVSSPTLAPSLLPIAAARTSRLSCGWSACAQCAVTCDAGSTAVCKSVRAPGLYTARISENWIHGAHLRLEELFERIRRHAKFGLLRYGASAWVCVRIVLGMLSALALREAPVLALPALSIPSTAKRMSESSLLSLERSASITAARSSVPVTIE